MPRPERVRLLVAAATFCLAASTAPAQQPLHRGHRANADIAIRLYLPAGRVRVVAWARDSVDVRGTLAPGSSFFGGGTPTHGKMGVEAPSAKAGVLARAELTLSVPRRARVWVKMINGSIDTDGLVGDVELYTVGGNIVVRRGAGSVSIESIDAPVVVEEFTGASRVRAGKGSVRLGNVTGTSTVTTVSGSVSIAGTRVADARVETIGGHIEVDVPRLQGAVLDLQTHSGDVMIATDRAHAPLLDLLSRGGSVPKPVPGGNAKEGRVLVRSFKGAINVRESGGIKGAK